MTHHGPTGSDGADRHSSEGDPTTFSAPTDRPSTSVLTPPGTSHPALWGTLCALLSAVGYTAANIALRRLATHDDVAWAIWVSCVKALPATLVSWLLVTWRAGRGLPALPPLRLVLPLVATGLFMQFGGNVMFQWGLSLGGLALTVPLCFGTLIVTGAVLGRMALHEPITYRTAVAIVMLIAAIVTLSSGARQAADAVVSQPTTSWITIGAVLTPFLAGVAYATGGVVIRRTLTREVSLSGTLVLISTSGLLGLGLVSLVQLGPARLAATSGDELAAMLAAGTFNALAFYAVSKSLHLIPVVRVNALNSSQAAMAAVAGVLFFGEPLGGTLVAGIALTMGGLLVMEQRRKRG